MLVKLQIGNLAAFISLLGAIVCLVGIGLAALSTWSEFQGFLPNAYHTVGVVGAVGLVAGGSAALMPIFFSMLSSLDPPRRIR